MKFPASALRRSLVPMLVGALGLTALAGCASAGDEAQSQVQAESFPAVYQQELAWEACNEDDYGFSEALEAKLQGRGVDTSVLECATMTVPLDWNDPSNEETVQVAVNRIPATGDDTIGSLMMNPGGPGASGLTLVYGMLAQDSFAPIRAQYDIVGFDPRGIGRSTPIDCDDASMIQEINIARCADENPLALTMGTSQVARDMELLRVLLGDDSMHYLGYSYGTGLGATYATLFPETVGRMVLDSAIAADWASPIRSYDQAKAIADQMVAMVASCEVTASVSACPVTSEDGLSALIDDLTEEPLVGSDGEELSGGTIYGYLITGLYGGPVQRETIMDTFARAIAGEVAAIDDIIQQMSDGGAAVSLAGTIVRCHSFPTDPNIMGLVEHMDEVGVPDLLGGDASAELLVAAYGSLACDALPNSGDDITDTFSGSDDAPILVIGITGDNATPYAGAIQLTEELGNATLLTLDSVGHAASYSNRSGCIDDATTAYLLDGELPDEGTVCAEGF